MALIIEALTDNRNKAAQEVKHILTKNGFSLAAIGSASWAFEKKDGRFTPTTMTELSDADIPLLEKLISDLEDSDEVQEIFTNAQ